MNVLLLTSFLVITADPVKPKIPLGKETTYVNGPLDKNGFVDYPEALDSILGKGVTKENNAVVVLWRAIGPSNNPNQTPSEEYYKRLGIDAPVAGNEYIIHLDQFAQQTLKIQIVDVWKLQDASRLPWKLKDHPTLKLWIDRNTKALDHAVEASKRPQFYHPQIPKSGGRLYAYDSTNLPQGLRTLIESLQARAMMNVGLGENEKAWDDILASHRLVRHMSRGPFVFHSFVTVACHRFAYDMTVQFCQHTSLNPAELSKKLKELQQLPAIEPLPGKYNIGERFAYLDSFRVPESMITDITEEQRRKIQTIDFTEAMKIGNANINKIVKLVEMQNRVERKKAIDEFTKEYTTSKLNLDEILKAPGKILDAVEKPDSTTGVKLAKDQLEYALARTCEAMEISQQYDRNLRYFQLLLEYHADHKKFPVKLTDLKDVPIDIFTGEPMIYRTIEGGFLLYSIGANGKDDAKFHSDRKSDDIVVRFERKK